MKVIKPLFTLAAVAALTACGGGTDGPPSATTVSTFTPEGHWTGTTNNGWAFNMAILEDGQTWGLYYSGSTIFGAITGKSTWTTNTYAGTGTEFVLPARSLVDSKFSGTFTRKANLTVQSSGGVAVNTSFSPSYDQPASLTAAKGVYSGPGATAKTIVTTQLLTVADNGAITGSSPNCSLSGVLIPRASGKGVFNVFLDRTGTNCIPSTLTPPPSTTTTFQGLAFYDAADRRLLIVSTNSKTETSGTTTTTKVEDGFFFVGSRN